MPRRIIAAALPHLAAEALMRREGVQDADRPFAVTGQAQGAQRLVSVSPAAAALGLAPGLGLADARALVPALATRPEEPERLAAFRRALLRWAGRFSPLVAAEGDALILDATGCAHLFGGEAGMLAALADGLAGLGLTARAAIADTRGAAWGLAHYGRGGKGTGETVPIVAPQGRTRDAIAGLPVAALRLEREAAEGLAALGLGTVGDVARVPRGSLARRFGLAAVRRLDQALGAEPEPVAPDRPLPVFAARLTLPEPIGLVDDLMAGLERLLARLCTTLEAQHQGARSLRLTARRVDGADVHAAIALARPGRDPARLAALFRPGVETLEAGYGIDALRLEATATEPLKPAQVSRASTPDALADLLSRLGNRIGFEALTRFLPAESHIPERAFILAAAAWSEAEPFATAGPPRPLVLFPPERVQTEGDPGRPPERTPIHPPGRFRWRGRWLGTVEARGPERLAPEWWWDDPAWRSGTRDYWQVATAEGPRLWLFRTPQAAQPEWWVQGEFA